MKIQKMKIKLWFVLFRWTLFQKVSILKFLILLVLIFDMQIYITFLIGSIRAEFTFEWFFSRMNHDVPFQTLRSAHFLLTIWATKTMGTEITWNILKLKIFLLEKFVSKQHFFSSIYYLWHLLMCTSKLPLWFAE